MAQREIVKEIANVTKSQASTVWLFDFLQKYGIILAGIIILYPLLKKWYEQFSQDAEEKALENEERDLKIAVSKPSTKLLELNKVTTDVTLHSLAETVAFWLGTNIATKDASLFWWLSNPTAWVENEDMVIKELQKVKYGSTVPKVIRLYYIITRRDLKTDLKKYLSTSDLKRVPLFN